MLIQLNQLSGWLRGVPNSNKKMWYDYLYNLDQYFEKRENIFTFQTIKINIFSKAASLLENDFFFLENHNWRFH